MTTPIRRRVWMTIAASIVAGLLPTLAVAQWKNLSTDGVPRGADGKPDMTPLAIGLVFLGLDRKSVV